MKVGLYIYLLTIFIVSFLYQPVMGGDLGRYFKILDIMRNLPITSMNNYATDPELFITNFIFWLIAKTGIYNLLPAVSTTIVYGIGYYLISDYLVRVKMYNSFGSMLILQFMQLPLISIIENVRNVCAFSIVVLALYRELVQKRKTPITYLLYIVPCFIHSSVFVLIFSRILLPLVRKLIDRPPIFVIFIRQIIDFLFFHQAKLPSFFASAIEKGYSYLWNNTSNSWLIYVNTSSFFKLQKIVEMTVAIVFIIIFYITRKKLLENERGFCDYLYLMLLSILACNAFEAPHYWRYYSAVMLMLPIFLVSIKLTRRFILYDFVKYFYIFASLIMFLLNVWNTYSTYS